MMHLTIKEAIKIIERKTEQTLTYPKIAQLYKERELYVCFEWQAHNCQLGVISNDERLDLISEAKLIAMRGTDFKGKLYLTPSRYHEGAVFCAIEKNSNDPIEMQAVRQLGSKRQLLLMTQDSGDQYLYDIESKYKNGWQLFDSPKYFFELEREEGVSASYAITVNDLLITRESLNAYIAKVKAKKGIDKYSPDETKKLAIRLARHIIAKDPDGIVSKAQLAKSIIKALKGTGHNKNIKGSDEKGKEDNVENWIKELKKGKVGRKSNNQNEEMQALISEAIADFPEEINRQK
ncbi:hypothetical protein KMZ14_10305 [Acinetobacter schindleri]|uniref:hypothetical protein n=1 Tax=Acinetobacter schindleri TaxID=108981 RepID=UPI00236004A0|nr:hypothetical protein [Acinetobacter schindleri]WDE15145.1 hypothetical protein KMZ14_10305 [Acinetobacter schindleri]